MVSQDRWSLVTGRFTLKSRVFCPKLVVLQDRWSLLAVVSQDRFYMYKHQTCCIGCLRFEFPEVCVAF